MAYVQAEDVNVIRHF